MLDQAESVLSSNKDAVAQSDLNEERARILRVRVEHAVARKDLGTALLLFAVIAGPLLGASGYGFGSIIDRARRHAAQGEQLLWRMPLGYVLLGLLAIPFPLILGNGHGMAQSIFAATVPLGMAVALAITKPIATLVTVLTGATGGRLTPSLATGGVARNELALLGRFQNRREKDEGLVDRGR